MENGKIMANAMQKYSKIMANAIKKYGKCHVFGWQML